MTPAGVPGDAFGGYWSGDAVGLLMLLLIMVWAGLYWLTQGLVWLWRRWFNRGARAVVTGARKAPEHPEGTGRTTS